MISSHPTPLRPIPNQALRSKPTWFEGSVLLAAVDSKEPGMVKEVLDCVRMSLTAEEVNHD